MKEVKFEIPVPAFLGTQKIKDWTKIGFSVLWLAATIFIGMNYDFSFLEMLILAYFGLCLIWRLDSRISASLALFFLIATPILLMLKNDALAETVAIYAYYFLVITVIQLVFELKNGQKTAKRAVDNFTGRAKRKIV